VKNLHRSSLFLCLPLVVSCGDSTEKAPDTLSIYKAANLTSEAFENTNFDANIEINLTVAKIMGVQPASLTIPAQISVGEDGFDAVLFISEMDLPQTALPVPPSVLDAAAKADLRITASENSGFVASPAEPGAWEEGGYYINPKTFQIAKDALSEFMANHFMEELLGDESPDGAQFNPSNSVPYIEAIAAEKITKEEATALFMKEIFRRVRLSPASLPDGRLRYSANLIPLAQEVIKEALVAIEKQESLKEQTKRALYQPLLSILSKPLFFDAILSIDWLPRESGTLFPTGLALTIQCADEETVLTSLDYIFDRWQRFISHEDAVFLQADGAPAASMFGFGPNFRAMLELQWQKAQSSATEGAKFSKQASEIDRPFYARAIADSRASLSFSLKQLEFRAAQPGIFDFSEDRIIHAIDISALAANMPLLLEWVIAAEDSSEDDLAF